MKHEKCIRYFWPETDFSLSLSLYNFTSIVKPEHLRTLENSPTARNEWKGACIDQNSVLIFAKGLLETPTKQETVEIFGGDNFDT